MICTQTKIRPRKFSGILRYKRISYKVRPFYQLTRFSLSSGRFSHSQRPQIKRQRKEDWKETKRKTNTQILPENWKISGTWRVTVIPIIVGALGIVSKSYEKRLIGREIRGGIETRQTTGLLRLTRILRRVLEICGDLLSLKLQWKTAI